VIAFLGTGKLAEAIIRGALAAGSLSREHILVTCRRPERAAQLRVLGLKVVSRLPDLEAAEVAVLGVRHRDVPALLADARNLLSRKTLISLVTGVPSSVIERMVRGARVVRATTNTPAAVGLAVTALSAGATAMTADMAQACKLFSAVGQVVELLEALLDAAVAISGVGPAYLYPFASALAKAGASVGLEAPVALRIATQTLLGAAALLAESRGTIQELIAEVAGEGGSPGLR
jgi:pyrroline-5-carboxylate reductase